MNLDRKSIRSITGILFSAILFCVALLNLNRIWGVAKWMFGILWPVILGMCVAFVLIPMMSFFEEKVFFHLAKALPRRGKALARGLSIVLCLLIICGVLTLLCLVVIPQVRDAFQTVGTLIPGFVRDASDWVVAMAAKFGFELEGINLTAIDWKSTYETVTSFFAIGSPDELVSGAIDFAASFLGGVVNVTMGVLIALHIMVKKEAIGRFLTRFIQAYFKEKPARRIFEVSHLASVSFHNFVFGQLTEAVVIGVLCFIGMTIFRFPYAIATSTTITLTALIPVLGAWIGAGVGALLALTQSPLKALLFIVFIFVLQTLENNLIYPKVVGSSMSLPGILVLIAVLVGGSVAGVGGMLLGVPLCSILYTLVKQSMEHRIEKRRAAGEVLPAPPTQG